VHAKTDETGGSCLPTRDTTANVDEQHEGIISNSSRFTNSSLSARNIIIFAIFYDIDAFTNLYALFPHPFFAHGTPNT
jgi:hypothetical protein